MVTGMMEMKPSRIATRWRWLPIFCAIGMNLVSIQCMKPSMGDAMSSLLRKIGVMNE